MSKKHEQIEFLGRCESLLLEDMINEVITLKEACRLLYVAENTL